MESFFFFPGSLPRSLTLTSLINCASISHYKYVDGFETEWTLPPCGHPLYYQVQSDVKARVTRKNEKESSKQLQIGSRLCFTTYLVYVYIYISCQLLKFNVIWNAKRILDCADDVCTPVMHCGTFLFKHLKASRLYGDIKLIKP